MTMGTVGEDHGDQRGANERDEHDRVVDDRQAEDHGLVHVEDAGDKRQLGQLAHLGGLGDQQRRDDEAEGQADAAELAEAVDELRHQIVAAVGLRGLDALVHEVLVDQRVGR